MLFYKEKLQVQSTARLGWFLGSHPFALNTKDLEEAIEQTQDMLGINIEVKSDWICIEKGVKTKAKAAHIYSSWKDAVKARLALNNLYGKNAKEFPLGRNMRFVPNNLDDKFIVTTSTLVRVKKSVQKQIKFLKMTNTTLSDSIRNLDYYDTTLGYSLRELVMGLRSRKNPTKNLFLGVEDHYTGNNVVFLYKNEFSAEAKQMAAGLHLALEAKLGHRIWQWFDKEAAQANTSQFKWCNTRGIVEPDNDPSIG